MSKRGAPVVAKQTQLQIPMSNPETSARRAGSMRVKEAVLEAVKRAIDNCPLERDAIADELSRLVGEEISVHTLNNWCSSAKPSRRVPLEWAKALTLVTDDQRILEAALGPEFLALDEDGAACLEYGRMVLEDQIRSKRKRELKQRVIQERFLK